MKQYFCAWQMRDKDGWCDLYRMTKGYTKCHEDCEYYPKHEKNQFELEF